MSLFDQIKNRCSGGKAMITLSDAVWAYAAVESREAEYLVSLMSPQNMIATPPTIDPGNHLRLMMDDVELPSDEFVTPSRAHIDELLEFGESIDENSEVVVHCSMGMQRSPAAIIILLSQWNRGREIEVVKTVSARAPKARPNQLIIRIGDEALGCDGALISAVFPDALPEPLGEPTYRGSLDGFESFPLVLDSAQMKD